jgi:hypothetical protein
MNAKNIRLGLAMCLAAAIQMDSAAHAQPVDFEVVGPAGMSVEITALGVDGAQLFSGKPTELEIDGRVSLYKARAVDSLAGDVSSWCVVQAHPKASGAAPKLCSDKTVLTAGTRVFPAPIPAFDGFDQASYAIGRDGVTLAILPNLPNSTTCVQLQLTALGSDVGVADGAIGQKTKQALAQFVATAKVGGAEFSLPAFNENTATIWCAALSQIPAALPAFQAFVGKNTAFTSYFSNLILAPAEGQGAKDAKIIGNVTLLLKGPTFAVRISGSGRGEQVFGPTVRRGGDPTLLANLTGQVEKDTVVSELLLKGLGLRGLSLDADLVPALARTETLLQGQVPWTNEQKRFDLFAELDDGSHAIYLVYVGPSMEEAKLFAFAVLDRQ